MRHLIPRRYLPWVAAALAGAILTLVVRLRGSNSEIKVASAEPAAPVRTTALDSVTLLSRGAALLAVLLMALSAALFRPANGALYLRPAAIIALLGTAALLVSLRLNRANATRIPGGFAFRPPMIAQPRAFTRLKLAHWFVLGLGIVYLAVLAEINGGLLRSPLFSDVSHHVQFVLFVFGIAFVAWGIGGSISPHPKSTAWRRDRGARLWIPLLITLLAFAVRFWELGDAVHHFVDEIHFSTAVAYFWQSPDFNVPLLAPFGSITAFPWLFPYLQFGAVGIFGRNLEGLRAVSAVMGTLTVPALYLLARALFDRKTALLAALLLATFPPHVNFSRIGLNNTADPLFGTLALAFLARGLKYGRRMNFALGGAALGLTQYFYEGGRFLYVFLVCLWLIGVLLSGRRDWLLPPNAVTGNRLKVAIGELKTPAWRGGEQTAPMRQSASSLRRRHKSHADGMRDKGKRLPTGGIFVFLCTALLVAAPVYYTLYAHHRPFAARMDTVGVGGSYWIKAVSSGGGQTLEDHLVTPLLVFVHLPEQALYYGGEQPMILEVSVPAFLLGIAYALWRWRGPGMLLLLWILLTCVGNSLMAYSAIYARYVVVFPALALLMALGVRCVPPLILSAQVNARLGAALAAAAVVAIAVVQGVYYFGPHLDYYNQQIRPRSDEEDALFRSVPFPAGTNIHLVTWEPLYDSYVYGVLGYLADHLKVAIIHPDLVTPEFLSSLSRRVDHAFYVEPNDTLTPQLLAQHFAELQPPAYSPFNVPRDKQFVLYYAASTQDSHQNSGP